MGDKKTTDMLLNAVTGGSYSTIKSGDKKDIGLGVLAGSLTGGMSGVTQGSAEFTQDTFDLPKKLAKTDESEAKTAALASPVLVEAGETATEAASVAAKEIIKKKKKQTLLSGGQTDITGGAGLLTSGQVSTKTLLGA